MADQLEIIRGGPVTHAAIRAFRIKDAALLDGNLYSTKFRRVLHEDCPRFSRRMFSAEWMQSATLATTYFGALFFGHWLTDDLPLALLGSSFGVPVATERRLSAHQLQYLDHTNVSVSAFASLFIDELIVFDDHAQAESKRLRYIALRDRLRTHADGIALASYPGAFLRRGSTGQKRLLLNEDALCDALASRGFKIIDPECLSVASLITELLGAKLVVGVEGSHLLHGLYALQPGASFLALQPPDRFSNPIKYYADALGLGYGFVVGYPDKDGFRIDFDEMLTTFDLLRAPSARQW